MYKKLTEEYEEQLFQNYNLTELMLVKKNKRRFKISDNLALDYLLRQKLNEYGLSLFGVFEKDGLTFKGIRMLEDFPAENEPILKQLYGYINFTAHIQLRGFDNFAVAFDYNVDTGRCELQRHSWGAVTHRIEFINLASMLECLGDDEDHYVNFFKQYKNNSNE